MTTAKEIIANLNKPTDADRRLIEKAYEYAQKAHEGHKRYSGEPYMTHVAAVGFNLAEMGMGPNTIASGLLHDTIEDTDTTHEDLEKMFGGLVAGLVKELTSDKDAIEKIGKKEYLSRKMETMSSYALVVKLADRLDNVQDIATAKTPEWRQKYKKETMGILARLEKNRKLSGTHKKIIKAIKDKLDEVE